MWIYCQPKVAQDLNKVSNIIWMQVRLYGDLMMQENFIDSNQTQTGQLENVEVLRCCSVSFNSKIIGHS